ncbi:MAG: hypothetical protein PF505_12205 [Vallitaleaceae bacterium]|jgi:hypothetical protein|nr:hypothetical protein [Vallitaleaceae bacterium]
MVKINDMLREASAGYNVENQSNENIYHNTLALLRLYSKVLWRVTHSINEMNEECIAMTDKKLSDFVDMLVDIDPRINSERLNSRLESIEHSKSIIDFINQSLLTLKQYPDQGDRYFDILNRVYINKLDKPIEILAEQYDISRATLFREKKKAINMFGVILWGYIFTEIKN